jgi:alanyl-tRNA synthetase
MEFNFRWLTETLQIPKEKISLIEDVWQGGGSCGGCVEMFVGGLELGNMVFTEYYVNETGFSPLPAKVIDVGIGLERMAWLANGG